MSNDTTNNLSVALVLGIIFKSLPLKVLQPFLAKSMNIMQEKHYGIFERISDEEFDFVIDATDLPFIFYLKPSKSKPILKAVKRGENINSSAKVKGTLTNLLKLFEGSVDGDAIFFSKDLVIEGSTAATVALRNAVDGEEISIIKDLSEIFSPFEELAEKFGLFSVKKYNSLQDNFNKISYSILASTQKEISSLKNKIYDIEEEIDNMNLSINKIKKEDIRKKSDYNSTTIQPTSSSIIN